MKITNIKNDPAGCKIHLHLPRDYKRKICFGLRITKTWSNMFFFLRNGLDGFDISFRPFYIVILINSNKFTTKKED